MKVAIIHDFLTQYGGAERVLQAFLEIYPEARVFTLIYDKKKLGSHFSKYDIQASPLQNMPLAVKKYKWYLASMPAAIESFDLTGYDLIISSSSAFAKGIINPGQALNICYCYTPTRYLWSDSHFYLQTAKIPWPASKFIGGVLTRLRMWDYLAAQRPDYMLAISQEVKKRISHYYHRDSEVIYPFVNSAHFAISNQISDYYLIAGRMVPYKRNDIVIRAFNDLGLPLKVVGDGYGLSELKKIAKSPKIEFLGRVNEAQLKKYLANCRALIFPAAEDFGIVPLEAMASGRPIIAYRAGGALETIKEGITGTFFDQQTPQCLADAIRKFNPERYHSIGIRQHALKFDISVFKNKIQQYIKEKLNNK